MNIFEIKPNIICFEEPSDLEVFAKETKIFSYKIGKNYMSENFCKYYIVKPLDTFASVSKKLGINEQILRKMAGSNNLFIGQKISIEWLFFTVFIITYFCW